VAVGSYPLTITATDSTGSPEHSSTVVLIVNPPASFTLGAQPSSRSIIQGQSTTFDASVTPQGGYEGSGSFEVTGLPSGANGSFSPGGYANGAGTGTLTVTTSPSTPAGTYSLMITATDATGAPAQSTSVSLTVTPAAEPDFGLTATPGTVVLKRGRADSYNITVTPNGGFNETLMLSVTGLPPSATASFSPNFLNGGGTSTLTITTSNPATPKGTFTLTITAQSQTKTRSTTVTLKVQ
jgi:serine protease AprX